MIINVIFVSICVFLLFLFSFVVLWRLVKKPVESYENASKDGSNDGSNDESNDDSNDESNDVEAEEEHTTESNVFHVNQGVHRRDSKIGSSLEFAYIDETCLPVSEISDDSKGSYEPGPAPDIPIVLESLNNTCDTQIEPSQETQVQDNTHETNKDGDGEIPHQDLYDKYLEPRPDVDSPYGFVFFPNKYWKQFQKRPPVCIPRSKCEVQPTCTNGVPVDVLDYTQIGSIMPKFEYREEE